MDFPFIISKLTAKLEPHFAYHGWAKKQLSKGTKPAELKRKVKKEHSLVEKISLSLSGAGMAAMFTPQTEIAHFSGGILSGYVGRQFYRKALNGAPGSACEYVFTGASATNLGILVEIAERGNMLLPVWGHGGPVDTTLDVVLVALGCALYLTIDTHYHKRTSEIQQLAREYKPIAS